MSMEILQNVLDQLGRSAQVEAKMTGKRLDTFAGILFDLLKVKPAFLGYRGFPNRICVSVNKEVIHGIPNDIPFQDGDVVSIDTGIETEDGFWDAATTVIIGRGSAAARRLYLTTAEALDAGCAAAKAGNTTHDIANAIQAVVRREGFHIIQGYSGHGIGEKLHMEPLVPNEPIGEPVKLVSGMRLAIEPMVSSGQSGEVYVDEKDKWTVRLVRGGLAAHFERTVIIK